MNVYDFDKTLFDGDSTFCFWKYELKKHPILITCLPRQGFYGLKYILKLMPLQEFKGEFYRFFTKIKDIDADVVRFWDDNEDNFFDYYKDIARQDDLVISASPEFLVKEGCKRLGITNVMASPVDKNTGKCTGLNCKGKEKVVRFKEVYGNNQIENFYSDSYSDIPLAELANNAFLIKKGKVFPWGK